MSDQPNPDTRNLHPGPCREKYWEELDDAGRIARLREIIKRLERRVESLSSTANDAHAIASGHSHGNNGETLMPVGAFNRQQKCAEIARRDEKYF